MSSLCFLLFFFSHFTVSDLQHNLSNHKNLFLNNDFYLLSVPSWPVKKKKIAPYPFGLFVPFLLRDVCSSVVANKGHVSKELRFRKNAFKKWKSANTVCNAMTEPTFVLFAIFSALIFSNYFSYFFQIFCHTFITLCFLRFVFSIIF